MAEPNTLAVVAAATVTSLGLSAYFPGLDLSALVGSFGGSFLFVASSDNMPPLRRVCYLLAGWIGGYMATAELLALTWTKTSGFSSFICGVVCVALATGVLEWINTGSMPRWLAWAVRRFTGNGKEV